MSESGTESGASGAAQSGNSGTDADAANGSAASANWLDGLSEGNRKTVETKGWKAADDVVASFSELEGKLGTAIQVPGEDAAPEDWAGFYARLPEDRRPVSDAKAIEFKRPDNLPPDMPYSSELADASKEWFAELGIPQGSVQGLHDKFLTFGAEQYQKAVEAQTEATTKAVGDTYADLTSQQVWGPKNGPKFQEEHEFANKAVKKLGWLDPLKKAGVILDDGSLTDPQIGKGLAAIGRSMFAEDDIAQGAAASGINPWKADTVNLTEQSAIVRKDPSLARRLIREAGKDPADYRL